MTRTTYLETPTVERAAVAALHHRLLCVTSVVAASLAPRLPAAPQSEGPVASRRDRVLIELIDDQSAVPIRYGSLTRTRDLSSLTDLDPECWTHDRDDSAQLPRELDLYTDGPTYVRILSRGYSPLYIQIPQRSLAGSTRLTFRCQRVHPWTVLLFDHRSADEKAPLVVQFDVPVKSFSPPGFEVDGTLPVRWTLPLPRSTSSDVWPLVLETPLPAMSGGEAAVKQNDRVIWKVPSLYFWADALETRTLRIDLRDMISIRGVLIASGALSGRSRTHGYVALFELPGTHPPGVHPYLCQLSKLDGRLVATAPVSESGEFAFHELVPRPYGVFPALRQLASSATSEEVAAATSHHAADVLCGVRVNASGANDIRVALLDGRDFACGGVVVTDDGRPLKGVRVWVSTLDGSSSVGLVTDAAGRFLLRGLARERYLVSIAKLNGYVGDVCATVSPQTPSVTLVRAAGGTLVVEPEFVGRATLPVWVYLFRGGEPGRSPLATLRGRTGRTFTFTGLQPGNYDVHVRAGPDTGGSTPEGGTYLGWRRIRIQLPELASKRVAIVPIYGFVDVATGVGLSVGIASALVFFLLG